MVWTGQIDRIVVPIQQATRVSIPRGPTSTCASCAQNLTSVTISITRSSRGLESVVLHI